MALEPTRGQIRYLQMLASGLSQAQIVFASGRARSTIYRQLWEVRRRLGAETLEQAVAIAMSLGLIKAELVERRCAACQVPILGSDLKICPNCGAALPEPSTIQQSVKPKRKRRRSKPLKAHQLSPRVQRSKRRLE